MAQVTGSKKNAAGVLEEVIKVTGISDAETHEVLLVVMDHHREASVFEVKTDLDLKGAK